MKKDSKYLIQRGPTWYVQHRVDGKLLQKTTGTGNIREARKFRDEYLEVFKPKKAIERLEAVKTKLAIAMQEVEDDQPRESLLGAWYVFEEAPTRKKCSEGNLETYKGQYEAFRAWMREHHPDVLEVRQVTPEMAVSFYQHLEGKGASPRTLVKYLNCFSLIWRILATQKATGVSMNIWSKDFIARPDSDRVTGRKRDLTPSEIERLISHADDSDLHDLLTILAFTGMRVGDAANLQWDSIGEKTITFYPRKTAKRTAKRVYIPILPPVRDVLESRMHFPDENRVFPELAESYKKDDGASIAKRVGKIFDAAGFERHLEGVGMMKRPVYGAHSLRHSFSTIAAQAGMPQPLIKSIVGHSSDAMNDHYTHTERLAEQFAINGPKSGLKSEVSELLDKLSDPQLEAVLTGLKRLLNGKKTLLQIR